MNSFYNQNYSKEDIQQILDKIQKCIKCKRYIISLNEHRIENVDFINEYQLSSHKQSDILLNIKLEDFCHTLKNKNPGYTHEVLYVFVPQVSLYDAKDEVRIVDIYIKFNLIEAKDKMTTVVISFHERNKPIDYLFRKK